MAVIRDPSLLVAADGIGTLIDCLGDGHYEASDGLIGAVLYMLDTPERRRYLRPGTNLEVSYGFNLRSNCTDIK
jgi:rapamycin-insensitive companion of mTOR